MYRCYSSHWESILKKNVPRITVVGEHKDGILRLAAARCSLKDRFVRKIGREIAENRLQKGEIMLEVKTQKCNSEKFHRYAHALIGDIWESGLFFSC